MNESIVSLLFVLLFTLTNPLIGQECIEVDVTSVEEKDMSLSESEALTKAANDYISILDQIGKPQNGCKSKAIMTLCAQNCRKVRNGKVLFEGKDLFAAQLDAGKEWLGAWSIDVKEVLISTDNRAAVIRYELATEKEDDLVIIAILRFDSDYLITEINEVHNTLEK